MSFYTTFDLNVQILKFDKKIEELEYLLDCYKSSRDTLVNLIKILDESNEKGL